MKHLQSIYNDLLVKFSIHTIITPSILIIFTKVSQKISFLNIISWSTTLTISNYTSNVRILSIETSQIFLFLDRKKVGDFPPTVVDLPYSHIQHIELEPLF